MISGVKCGRPFMPLTVDNILNIKDFYNNFVEYFGEFSRQFPDSENVGNQQHTSSNRYPNDEQQDNEHRLEL